MVERVLVCGGRNFADHELVASVLTPLGIRVLIEGGAQGADRLAREWAQTQPLLESWAFYADWELHGKAAGPIRNQLMLDEGKPDLVIAFPGGRGTADMIRRAHAAGVEVRIVEARTTTNKEAAHGLR